MVPSSFLSSPVCTSEPVLVLGAGLIGRLLAVQLAQAGYPVRLVDASGPDGHGAAAHVAAAMLAPLAEAAVTEPVVVAMGRYALQRWPALLARLSQPVFFQQNGTLIVWHRQDTHEAQRFMAQLAATGRALPDLPHPERLNGDQLTECEPALAGRFSHGIYLPEEGQLDNRQLLQSLHSTLLTLGVHLEWHTPWSLEQAAEHQRQQGGWVLDCRGVGAQPDWSELRGVRGEVIRLQAPEVNLQRPTRLLHPRYAIYIAPKEKHVYYIGATEIENDDRSPASVRSVLELLSAAYTVHPGFAEARILELMTQCRPTLPDNLPCVREMAPRLLQINGLYRHGFMIAPAVADAVMEWIQQGDSPLAQRLGLRMERSHHAANAALS